MEPIRKSLEAPCLSAEQVLQLPCYRIDTDTRRIIVQVLRPIMKLPDNPVKVAAEVIKPLGLDVTGQVDKVRAVVVPSGEIRLLYDIAFASLEIKQHQDWFDKHAFACFLPASMPQDEARAEVARRFAAHGQDYELVEVKRVNHIPALRAFPTDGKLFHAAKHPDLPVLQELRAVVRKLSPQRRRLRA
jgi:hypothetical protein